jgi:hypothetical protein
MFSLPLGPVSMAVVALSTLALTGAGVRHDAHGAAGGCAEVVDRPQILRVRIVPAGIEESVIEIVRAEVEAIWRPYNVTIVWESVEAPSPDLWVQFVDRLLVPKGMHRYRAIAWITFVAGVPQRYIRVSRPAAQALLQTRSWWDGAPLWKAAPKVQEHVRGRVIGRALAHEIGHYLLASRLHAKSGLMRAVLDNDDLVRPDALSLFRLEDGDVRALRAARLASCEMLARDRAESRTSRGNRAPEASGPP